jgi:hypothetical protein
MKKTIVIVLGIALVVMVILLLPMPKKIQQTMYGAEITPAGEIITHHKYLVEVLEFNYLFRKDERVVNITFLDADLEPTLIDIKSLRDYWTTGNKVPFFKTHYYAYHCKEDDTVVGSLGIAKDYQCFFMEGQESNYYIGSTSEHYSVNDIMCFFEIQKNE